MLCGRRLALSVLAGRAHVRWRWPAALGLAVLASGLAASVWLEGAVLLPFAALGVAGAVGVAAAFLLAAGWKGPRALVARPA